jgi:tRNA modification GTPase
VYHLGDTICAVGSPCVGAARGIVRVSGPGATSCFAGWFTADNGAAIENCRGSVVVPGRLELSALHASVECDLYVWPALGRDPNSVVRARSYTGEPLVEVHTVGSPPILAALVEALAARGVRQAEPGEFTLRAFLSGRVDLTQAEAVLGVVQATNPAELNVALRQLAGGLGAGMSRLRDHLLDLLAELEAGLDFAEEDIEFISPRVLIERLASAQAEVRELAGRMRSRDRVERQPRVVLIGCPNVGKSSLFNRLTTAGRALTSNIAGTTRDYLVANVELDGRTCQLIDTAGLVETIEALPLEIEAQAMSRDQRASASLELFCLDATRGMNAWEEEQLRVDRPNRIVVLTKMDEAREPPAIFGKPRVVCTSSLQGTGLDELRAAIVDLLAALGSGPGDVVAATAARCRESLQLAAESLSRASELTRHGGREELVAAEIRVAIEEFGKIVGAVYTDDLLDRIFSRFCIGK